MGAGEEVGLGLYLDTPRLPGPWTKLGKWTEAAAAAVGMALVPRTKRWV